MKGAGDNQPASAALRCVIIILGCVLALLQWRLWFSADGWPEVVRLRNDVSAQQAENEQLAARNARLQAEVSDLKEGFEALEERARSDLGMIGKDESFYLIVPPDDAAEPSDD